MSFFKKLKERLTKSSGKIDSDIGELLGEEPAVKADEAPAAEREPVAKTPAPKSPAPLSEEPLREKPKKEKPKRSGLFRRARKEMPPKESEPAPSPVEAAKPRDEPSPIATKKAATSGASPAEAEPQKKRVLDDELLEELEEKLIMTDIGADTALQISAALSAEKFGKSIKLDEVKSIMAREIGSVLEPVARPLPLGKARPQVVLVVGVNGSGKTTTIGKLASQFRAAGKTVLIAACDTFRAAAIEQLSIWAERAGVPVMVASMNSDPAALAYSAMERARKEDFDILMVDTAGRLQNRTDLMEELGKIRRVLAKQDESAPHNTILVLDATTGQNALRQVEEFSRVAEISGLVMTKLDGTAKGGILVALARKFGQPIHAIGVGEAIDDLQPFDPDEFARALAGVA